MKLRLRLGALLLAAPGLAGAAVNGLIVQLKDAPAHVQSAEAGRETAQALQPHTRWQRLLRSSELPTPSQVRPTGRAAHLLRFEQPLTPAEAQRMAAALAAQPEVAWVVPNTRERRLQVPTDPRFRDQWWLHEVSGSNASAPELRRRGVPGFQRAWQLTTGGASAPVAVLDTGRTAHPELQGRWLSGYDFVSQPAYSNDGDGRDADPSDPGDWVDENDRRTDSARFGQCSIAGSSWHGTIVAGIIAAVTNNGDGVAGALWDGRVVPVRVAGKCGADVADIVDGMRWAAGLPVNGVPANPNPARIINISFGGSGACNAAYQQAIDEIRQEKGAVVVAAAGNEHTTVTRPASCSGVVAVAALNRDGFKTNYSNFGPQVVISTVGGDDDQGRWGPHLADNGLVSVDNAGTTAPGAPGYARLFGTSFASPVVAAALSLMLERHPGLTAPQLIEGLRVSARPHVTSPKIGACSNDNPGRCICTTATCGAGMLDVEQAVSYAIALKEGRSYQPPNWPLVVIDHAEVDKAVALGADRSPNPPAADPPPGSGSGGSGAAGGSGGGALGGGWLLGLALAVSALRRRAPSRRAAARD